MSVRARSNRPGGTGLMLALVATVLSYQLNATMVGPLLPLIASEADVGVDAASAVMAVFFAASAVGGVVFARWSDSVGRRRALAVVLAFVAAGTVVCALAPSLPVLVAGRALQGLGAAVFPLSYLIVHEHLSPRLFGAGVGILTACNGGVLGLDGVLGGVVAASAGSRSVFWLLLVLATAAFIGVLLTVPRGAPTGTRMDWWGALGLAVALVAVTRLVAALAAGDSGGALAASVVLLLALCAFVAAQRRNPSPLIALPLLTSRTFWPVLVTTTLSLAALQPVVTYTVVILAQDDGAGFGLTPAEAAIRFLLPMAIAGVFTAPLAGWMAERMGWLAVLRVGLVLGVVAATLLALFGDLPAVVVGCSILIGIACNGVVLTTVNGLAIVQSPTAAPASLPALNGAAFGLGISIGIVLAAPHVVTGTTGGYATAFWLSAGLAVLALATTLLVRRVHTSAGSGASHAPSSIGSSV